MEKQYSIRTIQHTEVVKDGNHVLSIISYPTAVDVCYWDERMETWVVEATFKHLHEALDYIYEGVEI